MASSKWSELMLFYRDSVLNSYGQVFFSISKSFSILLLIASFADPVVGFCGLLSLLITVFFAKGMGLNDVFIRGGGYGYNSLMVGFVIGIFYQINLALLMILFFGSILTLFVTVWLGTLLAAYKLPYLSIPFILGAWIILLSTRSFEVLQISERGVYSINELWSYGGAFLVNLNQKLNTIHLPFSIDLYFKSLGAIIFQYNFISGFLVAVGLLIYSRIAFSLSLIGFYTGYLFCYFVQGILPELEYSYIGFNFILTAIALGGFFMIPSPKSYMLVVLTMPLVSLLMSALSRILVGFQLPVYSIPFSIIVILMVSVLRQRLESRNLELTEFQEFIPERNFYAHHNRRERFKNDTYFHIQLPFFGTWHVSQGHAGNLTHKEDWRFALDFVVKDDMDKTFKWPGKTVNDFYCYGLPVLAPAAGQVVTCVDGVEDNAVGDVNLKENWGNTLVIKHGDYLFSKLSHLKAGSLKVNEGDSVAKGEVLAVCGNSGRSPEPHIHFQLQTVPHVGAKTFNYPISYFISHLAGKYQFHSFDVPEEGQAISRPTITPLLKESFRFIPGMKMKFKVTGRGNELELVEWEVCVDAHNQSYIFCRTTGSCAWFTNNDTLHYFLDFKGSQESLLFYFYLGMHKVLLGYYPGLVIDESLPLDNFYRGPQKFLQDILAPFHLYLTAAFQICCEEANDVQEPSMIKLVSSARALRGKQEIRKTNFELILKDNAIFTFKVMEEKLCLIAEYQG